MEKINTYFDDIYEVLKKGVSITFEKLMDSTNIEEDVLRRYLSVFEDMLIIEITYPVTHSRRGVIKLKKTNLPKTRHILPSTSDKETIASYSISFKSLRAKVEICNLTGDFTPSYIISPAELGTGTEWFIEFVKNMLPKTIALEDNEYLDPSKAEERLRGSLIESIDKIIEEKCLYEDEKTKETIKDIVLTESIGFGVIDLMLNDDDLEEIILQGARNPISIYHRKYKWMKTNVFVENDNEILNMADKVARKVRRELSNLNPILDAYRAGGERICAVLYPIASHGHTIVIRKFKKNPWTIVNFIAPEINSLSVDLASLLWLSVQYELNILVGGGTASGKTSFLNALCQFIPEGQHVITIEEVEELTLPDYMRWNWIPLVERKPISDRGEVPMHDLVVASLRMRPDRIIMGEVRRPSEAEVLFEAMHTGHSAYCTMHADTTYQVYRRLTDKPFNIPPIEMEAMQLIVVQRRDRRTGLRRTYEVAEIEFPESSENKEFTISVLYRWDARSDEIVQINRPKRIFEEIYFHTGMTEKEILSDLAEKKLVLKWMLENKIKTVDEVGRVVSEYYKDKNYVLKCIAEKKSKL